METNAIRIVLLETAQFSVEGIKNFYSGIFQHLGYETTFKEISSDKSNYEGNKSVFRNEVVDLFIIDLSLGFLDSNDYAGLEIIATLKRRYPDLLIIANSNTDVNYLDTADRVPSFDLFVHKMKMKDEKYKNYIQSRIAEIFRRNVYLQIDYEGSTIDPKYLNGPKKIDLENLLRLITFSCIGVSKRTGVSRVKLVKVEGGMSKSEVYRIYGYTINGLACINLILKISLRDDAQKEYKNYLQYVKWYLPYTWRPEVIAHAYWNDIGCICYSHVFNDEEAFYSLSYHLKKMDTEKINSVIDKIFNPSYKTWYHSSNVSEEKDINKYYFDKWLNGRASPDRNIKEIVKSLGNRIEAIHGQHDFRIDGQDFPAPGPYLLGHLRGSYLSCICHGDLNSNNVLISESKVITFIDFQDTGIGHIFDDFVVMELSLRIYCSTGLDFFDMLLEERNLMRSTLLVQGATQINPNFGIAEASAKIRRRAFENFFPENKFDKRQIMNYLYALAVSAYGMLRKEYFQNWQKHQLLALTVAATKELSLIEQS